MIMNTQTRRLGQSFLLKLSQNLLLLMLSASLSGCEKQKNITFQLQASLTGDLDLSGFVPGIDVALDIINENSTILPDYHLRYDIVDAKCSGTFAVRGFYDHVTVLDKDTQLFIMGADCSVASEPIALLAPSWNLVQISTASTSPRLSNTRTFPTFMRPLASDASIATGFMEFMRYNGWRHFAIITQEEELFTLTRESLRAEASKKNIQILETTSFPTDHNPQNAVQELKESSGRIIFLNMYPQYAPEILCQAYGLGMTTPEYAWITHAWFYDDFWTTRYYQNRSLYDPVKNCTDEELMTIANQLFFIDHYPKLDNKDSREFIGGLTLDTFHELYEEKRIATFGEGRPDLAVQAVITYDAMWLAALALDMVDHQLKTMSPPLSHFDIDYNETIPLPRSLSDFDYANQNGTIIKELLYQTALNTTFPGASGLFKLLPNGDREPELRYYQYRPANGTLKRMYVGIKHQNTGVLEIFRDKLPLFPDGTPVSYHQQKRSLPLFVVYTILCVVGMAFAIVCLVFNIVFRKKTLVKLSSPNLNIVFIAGIILMYILVILLGIEDELVGGRGVNALCQIRIWIGTIAFTLAYGSVVAKSFRVYYIFKNLKVQKTDTKTKTIQDWHMFLLVGVAVLVDLIFLVIVTAVPTARLRLNKVELPPTKGEIPREIEVCSSESSSIWLPILIGFKAGEVVLSLFFVFENRKIKIRELIDNRVILFSVYTIVVACVALTPIIVLLYQNANALYGVMGAILMLTVTVLLCINFVPKIYALVKNPSGEVKLDLSSVVANMSTSKSTVVDKKIQPSSAHNVEVDLSEIKDDSMLNDKGSGSTAGSIEFEEAKV